MTKPGTDLSSRKQFQSRVAPFITEDTTKCYISLRYIRRNELARSFLVRLTANQNALLFQIRVTCFARYTV